MVKRNTWWHMAGTPGARRPRPSSITQEDKITSRNLLWFSSQQNLLWEEQLSCGRIRKRRRRQIQLLLSEDLPLLESNHIQELGCSHPSPPSTTPAWGKGSGGGLSLWDRSYTQEGIPTVGLHRHSTPPGKWEQTVLWPPSDCHQLKHKVKMDSRWGCRGRDKQTEAWKPLQEVVFKDQ